MVKITRVGVLDDNRLDVELSNGNLILFDLRPYLGDPNYAALIEDNRILFPKTDGTRIFWSRGPSITIKQMLRQVKKTS